MAKSVDGNPKNANGQAALGSLCLQAGNVTCAVPALERATQLAPEESQNHYQLALADARAGAADKAKERLALYQQMKARSEGCRGFQRTPDSEVTPVQIGSRP